LFKFPLFVAKKEKEKEKKRKKKTEVYPQVSLAQLIK